VWSTLKKEVMEQSRFFSNLTSVNREEHVTSNAVIGTGSCLCRAGIGIRHLFVLRELQEAK